jgi:hypothetical protein
VTEGIDADGKSMSAGDVAAASDRGRTRARWRARNAGSRPRRGRRRARRRNGGHGGRRVLLLVLAALMEGYVSPGLSPR